MRTLNALLAAGLLLPACGSKKSPPAKVTEEERQRSEESRKDVKGKAREFQKKRQAQQLRRLCEELACSDPQRKELEELIANARTGASGRGRRGPGTHREANAALADAFASDTFTAESLQTFHTAVRAAKDGVAARNKAMTPLLTAFHGGLDSTQRESVAALVQSDGLQWLTSARPLSKKLDRVDRTPDPQRRAERIATRLCKDITCAPDQEEALTVVLLDLNVRRGQAPDAARTALATAIRGDSLSAEAVTTFLDAASADREASTKANDAVWLALHAALSPEQRTTMSETVRDRGLQAIGGGRMRQIGGMGRRARGGKLRLLRPRPTDPAL